MKVEIELPDPPSGLEYTREYRCAEPHEPYMLNGTFMEYGCSVRTVSAVFILRKKEPHRLVFEQLLSPCCVPKEDIYYLCDDGSLRSAKEYQDDSLRAIVQSGKAFIRKEEDEA